MINVIDIKYLIGQVLTGIEMYSPEAAQLVFRTGLVESGYRHLRQKSSGHKMGPARSFFQIEPWVARSVINNYIKYRPSIKADIEQVCVCDLGAMDESDENYVLDLQLTGNILLGIAICRLVYRPVPAPIPKTLAGQAQYWKTHYNTPQGKGSIEKFIKTVESVERESK